MRKQNEGREPPEERQGEGKRNDRKSKLIHPASDVHGDIVRSFSYAVLPGIPVWIMTVNPEHSAKALKDVPMQGGAAGTMPLAAAAG